MFPVQLPVTRPSELSRCDEQTQENDPESDSSLLRRSDASLKASVERAIWKDEVLRAIEYYEIDVHARNGVIYLNGHIANTTSRIRIENAVRSVPRILGIRNRLILDEKLTLEVAGALGSLEHTHDCKFFTGSSHGVVSLTGIVASEHVKLLAEICAASNPNVRAVVNHVRVIGAAEPELPELPFLQPIIGETIYFLDGLAGIVEQVVINPNNRRVIAMLLLVNFSNLRRLSSSSDNGKPSLPPQLIQVPMDAVRHLTKISGFLYIDSNEKSRYQDLDRSAFFAPDVSWTPPYPYCPEDVVFPIEYQTVDAQTASATHQVEESVKQEGASLKENLLANDALGG